MIHQRQRRGRFGRFNQRSARSFGTEDATSNEAAQQALTTPEGSSTPLLDDAGLASDAAAAAPAERYTIQPGDNLTRIAARFGTTIDALAAANGISDPDRIRAGQVLEIPGSGSQGAAEPAPVRYTVQMGDSLWAIAQQHGTTVQALAAANDVRDPRLLRIGQVLEIPSTALGTSPRPRARPEGLGTTTGAESTGAESTGAESTGAESTGAESTGAESTGAESTAETTGAGAADGSDLVLGNNERYRDAILLASSRTGMEPAAVAALIDAEAAKREGVWDPESRATSSSATGLTQFLSGTWIGMARRSGSLLNERATAAGLLSAEGAVLDEQGLLDLRTDPELSIVSAAEYAQDNLAYLAGKGHEPTTAEETARLAYLAHHEGAGGAHQFLSGTLPEDRAETLLRTNVGSTRASELYRQHGSYREAYTTWLNGYIDNKIVLDNFRGTPGGADAEQVDPTPQGSGAPQTYTIRSGDNLTRIAARFGTTVDALASTNNISDPSRIQAGQTLIIPTSGASTQAAVTQQEPGTAPSWLSVARGELGVTEIAGSEHNPRVLEYHAAATATGTFTTDEIPWCSSFVNWVMQQAGQPNTNNALALSWRSYGQRLDEPCLGAIAVIDYGGGRGHVGFVDSVQGDSIVLLGGNQSNQVKLNTYNKNSFVAFVVPEGYTPTGGLQENTGEIDSGGGIASTR